jgi:hypothetical protein
MNLNKSAKLVTPGYTMTFILVTMLFYLWALPMIVPLISYIFVTYYAFIGSKPRGPLYDNPGNMVVVSH